MKRALIIIAIILLVAAVVGIVLLVGFMMNNYAETGSVFGSGFDFSGSFWENLIGDEVLDEMQSNSMTEVPEVPTAGATDRVGGIDKDPEAPAVPDHSVFVFDELEDGSGYSVYVDVFDCPDGVLRFPESYNEKPVTTIVRSPSADKADKFNIKEIIIPDSVTTIESYAFTKLKCLNSVTLGKNVETIGKGAFSGNLFLKRVITNDKLTHVKSSAFYGCSTLEEIELPDGLQEINGSAFSGCRSLKNINIPSSVSSIGIDAFAYCHAIESITIPNIEELSEGMFLSCDGLKHVKIESGTKKLGSHIFTGCSSLETVILPDTLTTIGPSAFENCSSLTSIELPDSLIYIESKAFNGSGLKSIHIPVNVFNIADQALCANGLESVTADENNERFHAVDNCLIFTKTKTVVIGAKTAPIPTDSSVNVIGSYAFERSLLKKITVPDNIVHISQYAFAGSAVEELHISSSVKFIDLNVLFNCFSLKTVVFDGTIDQWKAIERPAWVANAPSFTVVCTDGEIECISD